MTSTLFIVQIVLAILITIVVLMQKSSSIGLGAYSGSNESMFGAKGPAGFLTKFTFVLSFLFIVNTLAIGYFYTQASTHSVTDALVEQQAGGSSAPVAPSTDTPAQSDAPQAPTTDTPSQTDAPQAPTAESKTIEVESDGAKVTGSVGSKAPKAPAEDGNKN